MGLIGKPKLPSTFLQVICWVLGEYGTACGKYFASYIAGKLCDVAEAYSTDDTVKVYAVAALMKIYAFEIAAGRKVDILPECQALIEELLASHSTDLQQRAYELQAVIALDPQSVESVLPFHASCEDIEVDKSLSFLNSYVQQALEKGAQPYIPEEQRSGIPTISSFISQSHHGPSSHGLRFEAYELPKPVPQPKPSPPSLVPSTELVPVSEPSYSRETHQTSLARLETNVGSNEIKLRLDGVQKKWGSPSYSSPTPSASSPSSQHAVNGVSQHDGASSVSSKVRDSSSDYQKQQPKISPEKQKLAASLFGGIAKAEKRPTTSSQGPTKAVETKSVVGKAPMAAPAPPLPDLLDLGEPDNNSGNSSATSDPFKQLEGLLEPGQGTSCANNSNPTSSSKDSDLMGLYGSILTSGQNNLIFGSSTPNTASKNGHEANAAALPSQGTKGPNLKDALQKDSLVRQMGVTPTTQNPNLFKDLLG